MSTLINIDRIENELEILYNKFIKPHRRIFRFVSVDFFSDIILIHICDIKVDDN